MYIKRLGNLVFRSGDKLWFAGDDNFTLALEGSEFKTLNDPTLKDYLELSAFEYLQEVTLYNDILNSVLAGERDDEFTKLGGFDFYGEVLNIMEKMHVKINLDSKIQDLSNVNRLQLLILGEILRGDNLFILDNIDVNLNDDALKWLEGYLSNDKNIWIIKSSDIDFVKRTANKVLDSSRIYDFSYDVYNAYLENLVIQRKREKKEILMKRQMIDEQIKKLLVWKVKGEQFTLRDHDKSLAGKNSDRSVKLTKRISKLNKKLCSLGEGYDDLNYEGLKENGLPIILSDLVVTYPKINGQINYGETLCLDGFDSDREFFLKTLSGDIEPLSGDIYNFTGKDFKTINLDDTSDSDLNVYEKLGALERSFDEVTELFKRYDIPINFVYKDYGDLRRYEKILVNVLKIRFLESENLIIEGADKIDGEIEVLLQEMIDEYFGTVILASEEIKGDKRLNVSDGLFSYQKGQKRLTK